MKVNIPIRTKTTFRDILIANTFVVNKKIFMKTKYIFDNCKANYNCINLTNGEYDFFYDHQEVDSVECEINVRPR